MKKYMAIKLVLIICFVWKMGTLVNVAKSLLCSCYCFFLRIHFFQDQLLVRLSSRGLLILTLTAGDGRLNAFVGEGLLDGRWHTLAVR